MYPFLTLPRFPEFTDQKYDDFGLHKFFEAGNAGLLFIMQTEGLDLSYKFLELKIIDISTKSTHLEGFLEFFSPIKDGICELLNNQF